MEAPSPVPATPRGPSFLALALVSTGALLALYATAGFVTQLLNVSFGIWFTEIFIFFAVPWVLLRWSGRAPARATGLAAFAPLPLLLGFGLGVANFFALVVPLQLLSQSLAPRWMRELYDSARVFEGQLPVELALVVAGVGVVAPVCEEFFFRGVLQQGLGRVRAPRLLGLAPRHFAVVVTAVVFSLFHFDPVGFLARTELGLLFGLLLARTGSLWPGIAAHAANNLVSTGLYFVAVKSGATASAPEETSLVALAGTTGMGLSALALLLLGARQVPSLWEARPPADPEVLADGPARSAPRLVLPWALAAALAVALLAAVDRRGVSLSLYDAQHPLPPLGQDAPDALHAERSALEALRAQARRGEVPLEVYHDERERLARPRQVNR